MPGLRTRLVLSAGLLVSLLLTALPAGAVAPGNAAFQRTWSRTDKPVADGATVRTWMWGPEANSGILTEPYAESPNGMREVQYFDKSRMEITHPDADQNSIWYVTNGLLVVEMATGQLQTGDARFEARQPAQVNVAGDADDPTGPTYATVGALRARPARAPGTIIMERVDRAGNVTTDASLGSYNVAATQRVTVPGLDHTVAAPFWSFMNASGIVWENGQYVTALLFNDPYYATGLPITEAYWARVKVANSYRNVLLQCFERRCLTYTPDNPAEWQIEMGNVGQHYRTWRYETYDSAEQWLDKDTGGTLTIAGNIILEVPPGALSANALVSIVEAPPASSPPSGSYPVTNVYVVTVEDSYGNPVQLAGQVRIRLYWDPGMVQPGDPPKSIYLSRYNEASDVWDRVGGSVNEDGKWVEQWVSQLSRWTLFM